MDFVSLVSQVMPCITAAVRSYGADVLTRAEDTGADATVKAGQRLIRTLLTSKADRPGIEQAVTDLAAHPDNSELETVLGAQITLALHNNEKLAKTVASLLPSSTAPGQRSMVIGRDNKGPTTFGDNSPINSTKRKFFFLPFGLVTRLAQGSAAHPVITAVCSVLAVGTVAGAVVLPNLSASTRPPLGVNLIRDPGAEQAKPDAEGGVVSIPGWSSASGGDFTAAAYGTPGGFPGLKSPGPGDRGKNLFTGGTNAATSIGYQIDSIEQYSNFVDSGNVKFTLSAWLGGYAEQDDYATLTVTWQKASGISLGQTILGPVTETQRQGVIELLFRSVSGTVPVAARQARLTLTMTRESGEYNDGYADDLSLKIS